MQVGKFSPLADQAKARLRSYPSLSLLVRVPLLRTEYGVHVRAFDSLLLQSRRPGQSACASPNQIITRNT